VSEERTPGTASILIPLEGKDQEWVTSEEVTRKERGTPAGTTISLSLLIKREIPISKSSTAEEYESKEKLAISA